MEQYRKFLRYLKANHAALTEYYCPECMAMVETPKPKEDDVWYQQGLCPFCNDRHFLAVYKDGTVELNKEE